MDGYWLIKKKVEFGIKNYDEINHMKYIFSLYLFSFHYSPTYKITFNSIHYIFCLFSMYIKRKCM